MTFEPARPRHTLPLAGKDYELIGSMELIETVEYALQMGAGEAAIRVANGMPNNELARLISAVLTAGGHKTTIEQAKATLWDQVGLTGDENTKLRLHLFAFLSICLAPPGEREQKAKDMGELTGKLEKASRGKRTKKSA